MLGGILMKMEIKVFILSLIFSLIFGCVFTYMIDGIQKEYYVLQVGIYAQENNKDEKIKELEALNIEGDYYSKDDKFYVFAYLSDSKKEVESFQEKNSIKGIIKEYYTFIDDEGEFLKELKAGGI